MFKLILGRAGTGKTTAVLSRLTEAGQRRKQVLIVPEQQSHEAERALCRAGGDRVSLYAEVLSFSRLANRVFLAAGGMGEPELDAGGRLLLMHQAVKAVSDQLTVYARPSRRPAFLESLLATADELKSSCVQPELLLQAGRELPGPEGEKLRDLGLICGTYQAMTARTALDPRDRLTRTAEKLKGHPWAQGMDLWLDGFTDFTPQQREVLRPLLRQADSLTVTLTCDHLEEDEGGAGIFSPARRTAALLLRLAAQEGISCEVEHLVTDWDKRCAPLQQVEKQLFAHGEAEPVSCQGRVELLGALTPRSEVEQAAAGIRRLLRTQGLRCRDIGVTARDLSVYQPLIEAIFPRYQIPVFTSVMTDILEKPILTLVTAALDTVANGYRYDDVFRYLKTGLTDLPEEDRDLLENYVLKWNLRGSQWTQKSPGPCPRGTGPPSPTGTGRCWSGWTEPAARWRSRWSFCGKIRTGPGWDRRSAFTALWRRSACPSGWRTGWPSCTAGSSPPWRRSTGSCGRSCAGVWSSAPPFWGRLPWSWRSSPACSGWCSPSTTWAPSRCPWTG